MHSFKMMTVTLFTVLFAASVAAISIMPEHTKVLLNFGEADAMVTVMAPGSESDVSVSSSSLYTVGTITSVPDTNGMTNYSIPLSMEAGVGSESITVTINGESVTGTVTVAGIVIKEGSSIVSGDNYDGVTVGVEGTFPFDVEAVGIDGQPADVSGAKIEGMAISGTYLKQLDKETTSLTASRFILGISKFRTSSSPFKVTFELPSIELDGEVFETVLKVAQDPTTAKCVAIGGTYESKDGVVMIDMYNVEDGSTSAKIMSSTGSSSGSINKDKSNYVMPDQKIAFNYATAGEATIKCDDDTDAFITGSGTIDITVSSTSEELAKDFVVEIPEVDGKDQLTARLSITESSPDVLTRVEANMVVTQFCKTVGLSGPDEKNCGLEAVTAGSAILTLAANVENGLQEEDKLKKSISDCKFTDDINKECDYLTYIQSTVNAVGGFTTASAAGLATWTIVLIAGLGAFALIVLIMLGLLAVYRRSAEQSESDYSSSGPLGVPDPSDLLYEQSIVRDIYGRGDFPDGGPSAAVAEQREREAALREEFPRPPSSSGLSRGSVTDDASSTYSV